MQTKQRAINIFSAVLDAAQSSSFIEHLLSMPTDGGEFERMESSSEILNNALPVRNRHFALINING